MSSNGISGVTRPTAPAQRASRIVSTVGSADSTITEIAGIEIAEGPHRVPHAAIGQRVADQSGVHRTGPQHVDAVGERGRHTTAPQPRRIA